MKSTLKRPLQGAGLRPVLNSQKCVNYVMLYNNYPLTKLSYFGAVNVVQWLQ